MISLSVDAPLSEILPKLDVFCMVAEHLLRPASTVLEAIDGWLEGEEIAKLEQERVARSHFLAFEDLS